ncbi:multidrug effflux MFS transporter [Mycetocola zhujimingii]|uniref:multidrug effflux MFS transporter n=1 Tax=Mycetocola zhujimingii TaxID=2079792 RepID=UPI000D38EDD4|nr:multidrug effflux MFS transporter [Mycetocola zhujimingii]AWB86787.1 Bcr/CflA family drug resistance efflux transporter [Mycetocola zhujimingii]
MDNTAPSTSRGHYLLRLRSAPVWIATILATLTVFGPLSMDLYLPVLPSLADDLSTTVSAAQLTMTTCLFGLAFGQIIAGPLSDRYGRRRPLVAGLIIYTIASLLCALSPSIAALVAFRLVQGLAGGVGLVIAQAVGKDIYHGHKLTRYYSRIIVLSGLAAIVAPVIGGLIASIIDWRGFFVILTVVGVLVTAAVTAGFGETLPRDARLAGGMRQMAGHVGVLLRDRLFVGATISSSLTSAAYFAYLAGSPFVLENIYGMSPAQFALVFGANAAGFATFGFLAGRAAERWSERRVFVSGLVLMILGGAILTANVLTGLPLPLTLVALFLIAAGAATVSPPATTLALVDYPQYAGTAAAILGLARFAAGGIAAPFVGLAGPQSMVPMALVVLGTAITATVVYLRLVHPAPVRTEP